MPRRCATLAASRNASTLAARSDTRAGLGTSPIDHASAGGRAVRAVGLHLSQLLPPHPARPSALAEVDAAGRLVRLVELAEDEEILATVPPDGLVAVDAPLDVPNEAGNRDLERIIAWCDVPLFPVAGARLDRVVGGRRGATLAPALRAATRRVIEASPELILREILFERGLVPGAPPLDLADYRSRWLSIRPPAYRPKGGGRARPAGLEPAAEALGTVLDLDGLELTPAPRDLEAIADAARLDAVACAFAAHRALAEPERAVLLGAHQRGEMLIPADTNLRNRLAVNLTRMTASGEVHPETRLSDARF